MTFGMTLAEHFTMAASDSMLYIAVDYKNEANMKVAASNVNIKIHQLFSKQRTLGVCVAIAHRKTSGDLPRTCSNVQTILVIMLIKLILICLNNLFFNSFMKTKNKKQTVFRFPFFYENEKRLKALKIQNKNLLNMEMVVNYLNFFFLTEVKTKYKYRTLNFVFQFIKKMKWHFGYTDCLYLD